jgi:1-acyl-sn-glycerol-3-phosphate acyltransferase
VSGSVSAESTGSMQFEHQVQRILGWFSAPFWIPLVGLVLRSHFRYRMNDMAAVRREFHRIRNESSAPLLICANHLTLIDSIIIAWALVPNWNFILNFDLLPWNTPERANFANTRLNRLVVYVAKCIPIQRGGSRSDVAGVLQRVTHLLGRGEQALLFPEGGRSRSGRVIEDSAAWGVGRVVGSLPGCRVLCIYLRGDGQKTWSDFPMRGERFSMEACCIEPKSDARGARRSRDLAQQIVGQLARMEEAYFADRQ